MLQRSNKSHILILFLNTRSEGIYISSELVSLTRYL